MSDILTNKPIPSPPAEPPEVDEPKCRCGEILNRCPSCEDTWTCAACEENRPLAELMWDTGGCAEHAAMLAGTLIYKQGREIAKLKNAASRTKEKLARIHELCHWTPTGTQRERLLEAIERLAKIEVNCE